jgi:ribosomal 50S subunit-associated protein YjgA (DUF615 family)
LKNVIAELDRIAKYLEDFEEPWAYHLSYRIDKIAQTIEDSNKILGNKKSSISKSILDQYKDELEFLSLKESNLKELIIFEKNKNASEVYRKLKVHFGKLSRDESINFIKKVIKTLEK